MEMIPIVKPFLPEPSELMPEIQKVLYSGYIAEGEKVYEFEKGFGDYIQNPYVISLNSGTAALHIALLLAGVGTGDEVISTVLTAEPSNVAIKLVGAKVVWADIDGTTGLLNVDAVRTKITSKTKAIMLVHYAGMVADMDAFTELSKEFNIPIIEDAAHAMGAKYDGKMIGSISRFTIFSLQAIKHITTVDGGFLCLNNPDDYNNARLMRWFGLDKKKPRLENDITVPGFKYHMNNVNATIGLVQMKYIKDVVDAYKKNAHFFDQQLAGVDGVELMSYYPKTDASFWLYTLKVQRRADFIKKLAEAGISASELHLRNDRHSIFAESTCHLPNFENFYPLMVHLPCGWWVNQDTAEKIVSVIKQGW